MCYVRRVTPKEVLLGKTLVARREVFSASSMKFYVSWNMTACCLVVTDVSEELVASMFSVVREDILKIEQESPLKFR